VRFPPAQTFEELQGQEVPPGCSGRGALLTVSPKLKKVKYWQRNKHSLSKKVGNKERGPSTARGQIPK